MTSHSREGMFLNPLGELVMVDDSMEDGHLEESEHLLGLVNGHLEDSELVEVKDEPIDYYDDTHYWMTDTIAGQSVNEEDFLEDDMIDLSSFDDDVGIINGRKDAAELFDLYKDSDSDPESDHYDTDPSYGKKTALVRRGARGVSRGRGRAGRRGRGRGRGRGDAHPKTNTSLSPREPTPEVRRIMQGRGRGRGDVQPKKSTLYSSGEPTLEVRHIVQNRGRGRGDVQAKNSTGESTMEARRIMQSRGRGRGDVLPKNSTSYSPGEPTLEVRRIMQNRMDFLKSRKQTEIEQCRRNREILLQQWRELEEQDIREQRRKNKQKLLEQLRDLEEQEKVEQRKKLELQEKQRKQLELQEKQRKQLELQEKQKKQLELQEKQKKQLELQVKQKKQEKAPKEQNGPQGKGMPLLDDWDDGLPKKRELLRRMRLHRLRIKGLERKLEEERESMKETRRQLVNLRNRMYRNGVSSLKDSESEADPSPQPHQLLPHDIYVASGKAKEGGLKRSLPADVGGTKKKMMTAKSKEGKKALSSEVTKVSNYKKKDNSLNDQKPKTTVKIKGIRKTQEKVKPDESKSNTKPKSEEHKTATSEYLWKDMTREKLKPLVGSSKRIPEVYPNHYFQRLSILDKVASEELPSLVRNFMLRDDVSKECTAKTSSELEGKAGLRYRMYYLSFLYKQFETEFGNVCSYEQFCQLVPENVVKPPPNHWKFCFCSTCISPDLKYETLRAQGLIQNEMELCDIINDSEAEAKLRAQLSELKNSPDNLKYNVWDRNSSGTLMARIRTVSEPMTVVVAKFQEELTLLKSHLQRASVQLDLLGLARERALTSWDEVSLHIESSALSIYPYTEKEVANTDPCLMLACTTSYLWFQNGGQKIVALSDIKDYSVCAILAALEKTLLKAVESGKRKINIISDSHVTKYRNKSVFYFLGEFAYNYDVCLHWVFMEFGHSTGNAKLVRTELENVISKQISINPTAPIKSANDVIELIRPHTSSVLFTYNVKDVQRFRNLLPKLRAIPGTQKFLEVIVFPEEFWFSEEKGTFKKLVF